MSKKIGIIGVSGYTGLELVRLILGHEKFEIAYLGASSDGEISEIFPSLKGVFEFGFEKADAKKAAKKCDLVFLALPHKTAMGYAKEILSHGTKVVDLSADYRLSLELYEKNYTTHEDKKNLQNAVYGLVELNRDSIKKANLVANPGCYPTCSILAIAPFLEFIDGDIFIDAKSGVSGAGKGLKESSHFVSANENLSPYSPITHRHSDEIKFHLENFMNQSSKNAEISNENLAKTPLNLSFIPHLTPLTRGMMVSAFCKLKTEIEPLEILRNFYKDEKFIRVRDSEVCIKNTAGTHFCDIYAKKNGSHLWINSSIDNLLRGASSQALANANLMLGLDESLGLPKFGGAV